MKQLKKTLLTLVALLAVTTGAWATEFTSLKVGDVLHVGDAINTGTNYKVYGLYLDAGYQPATLVRANIGTNDITESETGAYYLIKGKNDFYFGIIWGAEGLGGYWPVTDTSDGISVTAITPGDYTELTFAVHEGTATPVDGFAWDKAKNSGSFTMPGGNVVLHVEYEPELTATFKAANALTIEAGKATVSVTENGQPVNTATLADGKLSPLYQGQTVILKASEGYKFRKVEAKKKETAVKVTAITLNKTATTITAGQTETLSVSSVTPDNATDQTVTWSSDNEAVATVDADGKVTAVALGTANITATANDGSGVTATCAVTVNKVVTINQSDWAGWDTPITKDGVTVSASMIDPHDGNLMGGGTFSTTLGNFTKIVVTTARCHASGTGWSGSRSSMTWAGTPASTVSFSGEFMGMGRTQTTIVCTIVPAN